MSLIKRLTTLLIFFGAMVSASMYCCVDLAVAQEAIARELPDKVKTEAKKKKARVSLEWEPIEGAVAYEIMIVKDVKDSAGSKPAKEKIFKLEKSRWSAKVGVGLYKMQIRSIDDRGVPGDWSGWSNFEVKPEVKPIVLEAKKDPEQQEKQQEQQEQQKPTDYYFLASYSMTKINYVEVNKAVGTTTKFPAWGGTGSLGIGYDQPDSQWGVFGDLALSGFTISDQNVTFASATAQGTYRKKWGSHQVTFSSGVYFKELPLIQGNEVDGFTGVGKVTSLGPMVGFEYWHPMREKMGLQINTQLYYAMSGSGPDGEELSGSLSYQISVLGSLEIKPYWMGFAGLAYRQDRAEYRSILPSADPFSNAVPGDFNSLDINGIYLNLILEYKF